MIRKRGIIATVIFVSLLVNAIPLVSNLFDIYNEPLDLDSPLVFADEQDELNEEDYKTTEENIPDDEPKDFIEAPEIAGYTVKLNDNQDGDFKVSQNDFVINVSGKMKTKKGVVFKKMSFDFYPPDELSKSAFENLRVNLPDIKKSYTQRKNKIMKKNEKGLSYFTLVLDIKNKKGVPVEVDWGNGFVITYIVKFDLVN